jgi:hypothetical protein
VAIFGKSEVEAGCRWRVSRLTIEPPLEGALSLEHGFMPERPTSPTLPDSHGPWDELAADLPGLFLSNRAQSVLERLPRLSAAPEALPDAALTRAAVILSALAHAYWRFGPERFFPQRITQVSTALPPSILHPWREVSRRLGRHEPERPFQSFYDLFLSNYRLGDGAPADAPRTIENMEVLVSSFRNEAERVFYMSFVEMHYHLTPMVGAICEIEDAMALDDLSAIVRSLARIEAGLGKATSVWGKISARPDGGNPGRSAGGNSAGRDEWSVLSDVVRDGRSALPRDLLLTLWAVHGGSRAELRGKFSAGLFRLGPAVVARGLRGRAERLE